MTIHSDPMAIFNEIVHDASCRWATRGTCPAPSASGSATQERETAGAGAER